MQPSVLTYLHNLLESENPGSVSVILEGLAQVFSAQGAGLVFPLGWPCPVFHSWWVGSAEVAFPWASKPQLLDEARQARGSVALIGDTSWLLSAVGPHGGPAWLVWVMARQSRHFTAADQTALALAGECLVRHLTRFPQSDLFLQASQRIRQQEAIEQVAAGATRLAHDFGNILTGILGFGELALPLIKADSLPHSYVGEVVESARQGARWVQRLQRFSRRFQANFVPTSLPALLKEEEQRPHWRNGVVLQMRVPDQLPDAAMEAESVRLVVTALLDNAREALAGGGTVTVAAQTVQLLAADCLELLGNTRPGPHLELIVSDNGPGLAKIKENLPRELFTSTKGRRRGLGLAVTYGILHNNQAGFRLDYAPGQGTKVRVFLPIAAEMANAKQVAPVAGQSVAGQSVGGRILVVDDDPQVLTTLRWILEGAGYPVQTATGAVEAITQFCQARETFHLVITDVVMPDMNGLNMARRLQERVADVNFLFISSQFHQDPLLLRFPLLCKPFEAATLLQAVRRALGPVSIAVKP